MRSLCLATGRVALLLLGALAASASPAEARELFVSSITVTDGDTDQGTVSEGTHDIRQIVGLHGGASLRELFPGYAGTEEVLSVIDVRGVEATISFYQGEWDLHFAIPKLGISAVIPGIPNNRDLTLRVLRAWLEGDAELPGTSGGSVTPLLRALVRYSPVDPIAGNPNSLQSKMFGGDYAIATSASFQNQREPTAASGLRLRADTGYSYFMAGPYGGHSYDLGLGYRWDPKPRISIHFDLPLAITRAERGVSYMASAAGGITYRVNPHWNVSGFYRMGLAGSFELGGLALLYQGTVTSHLRGEVAGFDVSMGNMVGLGSNIDSVEYGGVQVAYDLLTGVFRNGVDMGRRLPFKLAERALRWKVFYELTNYVGTDLYLENQHDVGIALSTDERPERVGLRLGWVGGSGYDSLRLQLTGRFF